MVMARWTATVQDAEGNAVPGCEIEVRNANTGLLTQVYSDRDGTVPLGNPFVSADATFGFHVVGGAYRITARKGAFTALWNYVGIGTMGEFDFESIAFELEAGLYPVATLADLNAYVPGSEQSIAGIVLNDPDPSNNGYYLWSGTAWEWQRGLPDTIARLTVIGGTENALEVQASEGVDPGSVLAFFIDPPAPNTGPVTIKINGDDPVPAYDYTGEDFVPGAFSGRVFLSREQDGSLRSLMPADLAARAAQSALEADESADRAADEAQSAHESADAAAASAGFRDFADVATLLANTTLQYGTGAGQVQEGGTLRTRKEGFSYRVLAAGAVDAPIEIGVGVKIKALEAPEGGLRPEQFGGSDSIAGQVCADAAKELGCTMRLMPGASYDFTDSDVIVGVPIVGGEPKALVTGRIGLTVGGGHFRGVHFEPAPEVTAKADHAVLYLTEDGIDIDVQQCSFDKGCIAYRGDGGSAYKAASVIIDDNEFEGTPGSSIVNAIELTSTGPVRIAANRYLGSYYRFGKLTVVPGSSVDPVLEANAINDVLIFANILKGSAGDVVNGPKQLFDLFSAGGRRVIFSGNIANPSSKIEAVFEFKPIGSAGSEYPDPWHEEIIVSNNIVKGEFVRAFQAAGAYGASYEQDRQKASFTGNIIEATNIDAGYGIIASFMHNVVVSDNIIEMASDTAYSIQVSSPEKAKVSGNQARGYIAVRGDANDNPTPCSLVSICNNDVALSTTTTYGVAVFNIDAAPASCLSITSNNVRHLGGTREAYRIGNAPFANGLVVGNTTSNNTYGLSTAGAQPTAMRVAANSWAA